MRLLLDVSWRGGYSVRPKSGNVGPISLLGCGTSHAVWSATNPAASSAGDGRLHHPALHKGKSPLVPASMSPDSVVLEMFFVRFPFGDPAVNEKLWEEIDEQQFPPELRERLARNGFRAGLVSGQMPDELSKLMQLSDKPAPDQ